MTETSRRPSGSLSGSMLLSVYRLAAFLALPAVLTLLRRRLGQGKEDPARPGERLGRASRPRPHGPLVWVHAASVGEALSVLSLIRAMRQAHPGFAILITTGTLSSARILAGQLPDGVLHQFIPIDRGPQVRRFLGHWRPDLALWMESEFWPNMLREVGRAGIPLVLLNGRVSDRSFARWRRFPGLIRLLLQNFTLCLGQSKQDTERLKTLGAAQAEFLGNLKFGAPALPADDLALSALSRAVSGRPLWIAASTHDGEEDIAARVHRQLAARHPGLLSIIVPRHNTRGAAIADRLRAQGLTVARRAEGDAIGAATDIYLADTMGELGLFYRLAPLAFIGKSLSMSGGQNPLEAALLDCAVLLGPRVENFRDICADMVQAEAALQVGDEEALAQAVDRLLGDEALRRGLAEKAAAFARAQSEVVERALTRLGPFLEAVGDRRGAP